MLDRNFWQSVGDVATVGLTRRRREHREAQNQANEQEQNIMDILRDNNLPYDEYSEIRWRIENNIPLTEGQLFLFNKEDRERMRREQRYLIDRDFNAQQSWNQKLYDRANRERQEDIERQERHLSEQRQREDTALTRRIQEARSLGLSATTVTGGTGGSVAMPSSVARSGGSPAGPRSGSMSGSNSFTFGDYIEEDSSNGLMDILIPAAMGIAMSKLLGPGGLSMGQQTGRALR